jgi:hypothetical protein
VRGREGESGHGVLPVSSSHLWSMPPPSHENSLCGFVCDAPSRYKYTSTPAHRRVRMHFISGPPYDSADTQSLHVPILTFECSNSRMSRMKLACLYGHESGMITGALRPRSLCLTLLNFPLPINEPSHCCLSDVSETGKWLARWRRGYVDGDQNRVSSRQNRYSNRGPSNLSQQLPGYTLTMSLIRATRRVALFLFSSQGSP